MQETKTRRQLSLTEDREQLSSNQAGPEYWRSLDELAQTEEFAEMVQRIPRASR